jgi:hypothetical protein
MRIQVYDYLSNFAGLTALVSTRIYPQRVPTGKSYPYLSYSFDGRTPSYDQDGFDKWNSRIITFNCVGSTLKEASDVSNQVFNAWDIQFQEIGPLGNKIYLHSTTLQSDFDDDDLFDGSEDGTRIVTQTYSIRYKES